MAMPISDDQPSDMLLNEQEESWDHVRCGGGLPDGGGESKPNGGCGGVAVG